eukprot:282743-Rhodomonas_salina.3
MHRKPSGLLTADLLSRGREKPAQQEHLYRIATKEGSQASIHRASSVLDSAVHPPVENSASALQPSPDLKRGRLGCTALDGRKQTGPDRAGQHEVPRAGSVASPRQKGQPAVARCREDLQGRSAAS